MLFSSVQQVLQSSVDNALLLPWIQMRAREQSKRVWLVKLGLSSLSGFVLLAIIFGWTYFLGLRGHYLELTQLQSLAEPPVWALWLGESSWFHLAVFSVIGVLGALVWRRPFFGVAMTAIFLFTGLLSVAGAVSWLLGERLGLKLVFWKRYQSEMLRNEVPWSLAFTVLVILGSIFIYRPVVGSLLPVDRFVLFGVTLLLWTLLEVFLSMAFYHFYWLKYKTNEQR